jgi:hypothetical protein
MDASQYKDYVKCQMGRVHRRRTSARLPVMIMKRSKTGAVLFEPFINADIPRDNSHSVRRDIVFQGVDKIYNVHCGFIPATIQITLVPYPTQMR